MARNFIQIIKPLGFKKVPWNKCPQGFEASNYQCFSHKGKNIWIEVYLTDNPVMAFVESKLAGGRGKFFDDAQELKTFIEKH